MPQKRNEDRLDILLQMMTDLQDDVKEIKKENGEFEKRDQSFESRK